MITNIFIINIITKTAEYLLPQEKKKQLGSEGVCIDSRLKAIFCVLSDRENNISSYHLHIRLHH